MTWIQIVCVPASDSVRVCPWCLHFCSGYVDGFVMSKRFAEYIFTKVLCKVYMACLCAPPSQVYTLIHIHLESGDERIDISTELKSGGDWPSLACRKTAIGTLSGAKQFVSSFHKQMCRDCLQCHWTEHVTRRRGWNMQRVQTGID